MSDAEPAGAATPEPLFATPPPAADGERPPPGALTRDYTVARPEVWFQVDNDWFHAASALPGGTAFEFIGAARRLSELAATDPGAEPGEDILAMFDKILYPASATRFRERLFDVAQPIDVKQLVEIMQGLMEDYGLRPTQPPSASSDGSPSPDGGTPSTDALQWQAPTP